MATLTNKTVTNDTLLDQYYLDYAGATIKVAPGESATFQITASNEASIENIPALTDRYVKLKNASGDWAYIAPNAARNGVKVTPTEPA